MATNGTPQQNEAREALADVADVERARVARLRTPRWYWHVSGATFLLVEAAIMLPTVWRIAVALLAAIGGGIGIGAYQAKTGYRAKALDREGAKLALMVLTPVAVVGGICLLIGLQTDWPWMALISGVLTYAVIVGLGPSLERRARR